MQDEMEETQAKTFILVNATRLARLKQKLDQRFDAFRKTMNARFYQLEVAIRRRRRFSSAPTQVVGSGGGDPTYERLKAQAEEKRRQYRCLW